VNIRFWYSIEIRYLKDKFFFLWSSPAPATVTSANLSAEDKTKNEKAARDGVGLAAGAPTTNIQFRLADGSRLVGTFNPSHSVSDLHRFINT
jgi:UBX domain-containing protein 1